VIFGLDILPMTLGGLIVGLIVAISAGAVSRLTLQREDASLAAFYLISLALGVLLVSIRGSSVDLMHVLFGTVLALNNEVLVLIGSISAISLATLGIIWRALVAECLDPLFLRSVSSTGPIVHFVFLVLVVLNLVGGFAALGTLLAVGLMILPAAATRFWMTRAGPMCILAVIIGAASSAIGLLASFHLSAASGPAIILTAGAFYILSMIFGRRGLVSSRVRAHRHRAA